ncbi:TraB/GumN family protein [Sphingomicrobium flavum]|uniref:TraB/GumN family protein n=1 Tax=Sphingomicrobium flavum TaxID=1229164 RepID=UPI0021AD6DE4|nr:TraB/GumN family protein [Sphingomicrobium flavum]
MKKFLTTTTAAIALAVSACAGAAPLPASANAAAQAAPAYDPAVFKLADEDTTIYMLGTIHLLPEGHQWRTDTIDMVMAEADELILEVNMGPEDAAKVQPVLMELGITPGQPPIKERVAAEYHARFDEMAKKSGVPLPAFDMMESWFAGFILMQVGLQELGLKATEGVEAVVRGEFKDAGKPIGELETLRQQLGFFDTLSEETQREFLSSTLSDPAEGRAQFDGMLAAWTRGDVDAIEATFVEAQMSEELQAALLTRRNANWAEWLDARLDQPGTILVAVGAGHLAGDGSVIDMLEDKGFTISRVDD